MSSTMLKATKSKAAPCTNFTVEGNLSNACVKTIASWNPSRACEPGRIDLLMQPGLFADALQSFGHGSLRLSRGLLPPDFNAVPEQRRNAPDRRAGCNATG